MLKICSNLVTHNSHTTQYTLITSLLHTSTFNMHRQIFFLDFQYIFMSEHFYIIVSFIHFFYIYFIVFFFFYFFFSYLSYIAINLKYERDHDTNLSLEPKATLSSSGGSRGGSLEPPCPLVFKYPMKMK